jgi:hypothetical protein
MNYCIANTESKIGIEIAVNDEKNISEAIKFIKQYFTLIELIDKNGNNTDWNCTKTTSAQKWGYNVIYLN